MRTTASQYAKALLSLSAEKSAVDQTRIAADFFAFLRRKGDFKKLSGIVKKLERLQDAKTGMKRVSVTTAFPANAELMKELEVFAKEMFESESVALDTRSDSTLIGGAVMKTDNHLVDASVAGKIKDVRKILLK
ncbi:MAG: F0F1 ATP synthase subunit delta [Candidatus Moranbacteria bacterium]|nr:F0F1 ATP synthase subunit delta [Candidatus Moranbacteria bacterium]